MQHVDVCKPSSSKLPEDVFEMSLRVGIDHVVEAVLWCEAHTNSPYGPNLTDGVEDLVQQSHTVADTAAVRVTSPVAAVAQELIDQVSVRSVNLDPIESRALCQRRGMSKLSDETWNLCEH
ncbi:hypothetical protein AGR5A_pb0142 [Agrobacterium genomosp. 5 str. CFBP 6626]|nr:hypothetical protein AGR5A_pb0142 [Agrobacterium genomosp. 5 str. CFBP 6626]